MTGTKVKYEKTCCAESLGDCTTLDDRFMDKLPTESATAFTFSTNIRFFPCRTLRGNTISSTGAATRRSI